VNGVPGPTELEIKSRIAALEYKVSRLYAYLKIAEPSPPDQGEVPEVVVEHLARGDKLAAIKAYRETFGVGLDEARKQVEQIDTAGG
jgi:ribosomal protein L7/L12